jgi:hypothetical protein
MSWTYLSDTNPKARKDHRCVLCDLIIPKGTVHVARRGVDDDGPVTSRMHTDCEAVTRNWSAYDWECSDTGEFRAEMEAKRKAEK